MARIGLYGGAYTARSLLANAQVSRNLFPEANPKVNQAPVPVTHYLTPGLTERVQPRVATVRGLYRATNGALYGVIGSRVYIIDTDWTATEMGTIQYGTTPVSMQDNGDIVVLVDGTADGYWWALGSGTITAIADAAFYGADRVIFLDGWFAFNRPATNQFYLSPNFWNGTDPFDALYIASKIGGPDIILSIGTVHRELYLVGALTTEVWFNSGGADFPFERQPGVFIEHGMLRGWTLAETDVVAFWLARDTEGHGIVVKAQGYQAVRVSNHAIEHAIQGYETINDAIGLIYQQDGHTFYVLIFPSADVTWVYDLSTEQWHERTWTDPATGEEHRHRMNALAFAFNKVVVGDWENGKLYTLDLGVYTDDGAPITRTRDFPHIVKGGNRLEYHAFQADMQVGTAEGLSEGEGPQILLRMSSTGGRSWSDWIAQSWGDTGEYDTSIIWRQLGMARDMVFRLQWSFPYETALNGAFIIAEPCDQ